MALLTLLMLIFLSNRWDDVSGRLLLLLGIILSSKPLFFFKPINEFQSLYTIICGGLIYFAAMNYRMTHLEGIISETIFLKGYNFGLVHMVAQLSLAHFHQILALEAVFYICRIYVIGNIGWGEIIHQGITSIYILVLRYILEKADRKQYHKLYESKESLEKFKDLIANYLPSGVLVLDKSLRKKYFLNKRFKAYLHNTDSYEEIVSLLRKIKYDKEKNRDIFPGTTNSSLKDFLVEAAANYDPKEKARTIFCYYFDQAGTRKSFEISIFPFIWDGNESLIVLLNDITAQESLISLTLANETKEQVISTVSHELRTPLNGLLGMLQMMVKNCEYPEMKEYLSICATNANLLLSFLNSILDLQQIKANRLKLNRNNVDIRKVLAELAPLFEFQCAQKGLFLQLELSDDLPKSVLTDKSRLAEVVINLTSNALKFTSKGGITIGARLDPENEEDIRVWVSDTGIGIKEEEKARLFKMFSRLDSGSDMNPHGAGLGLMISNSLIKLLNRSDEGIQFRTEWSKGSTFWFKIPAYSMEEPEFNSLRLIPEERPDTGNKPLPTSLIKKPFSDKGRRKAQICPETIEATKTLPSSKFNEKYVLLVDDNAFNVLIARKLIEKINMNAVCVYNGEEAITLAQKLHSERKSLCMIFMDCMMPFMDGYEATRRLRTLMRNKELPYIPIIALSARDENEDRVKSLEAGMDDHLTKPLNESDLMRVFQKYKIS